MVEFQSCPDCCAAIGTLHKEGCDISRCKIHGRQLFQCLLSQKADDCISTRFNGYYPGTLEAFERDWYTYLDENKTWTRCEANHPQAALDINRVMTELVWDSNQEKFI